MADGGAIVGSQIISHSHRHKLRQPLDALWHDDSELRHVSAQAIDQHGALAHQQLASAMHDQHALLLFALHRHEAHVRPRHRLADRLRIGRVVLAALEVGLDVARRHQPDLMAKRRQFPQGPSTPSSSSTVARQLRQSTLLHPRGNRRRPIVRPRIIEQVVRPVGPALGPVLAPNTTGVCRPLSATTRRD